MDGSTGPRDCEGERQSLSPELPRAFDRGFEGILGRPPGERERRQFSKYLDLLIKWGSVHRLIGSTDPAWIAEHLLLDSLLFLRVVPSEARAIMDFGAGAGLPGIPIAIARPEARVTLLEGRRRRASFLATCIRELELAGARLIAARAEDVVSELAGAFDAVVMRCAGRLDEILPLAAQFAKSQGGLVVAAGPPRAAAIEVGQWLEVPGLREGTTRRFAVLSRMPE